MKIETTCIIAGLGLVLSLAGCGRGASASRRVDPCDFQTVASGPYAGRTFRVCDEAGFSLRRRPLVIGLHGASSNAAQFILVTGAGRMNELATAEDFIAVYPNGSCLEDEDPVACEAGDRFFWDDCRADADRESVGDDIGYLRSLITTILPQAGVRFDPSRVYVWGHSNGAIMSFRVATELPQLVAGIASVSGNEPARSNCASPPPARTRVLLMHGTGDPLVPDDGGVVGSGDVGASGTVLSTDETLALWRERNGCGSAPTSGPTRLEDLNPRDGPRGSSSVVDRSLYGDCREGAELALYRIRDGGHPVPERDGATPFCVNEFPSGGCTNRDIDAADEIWAFFDR